VGAERRWGDGARRAVGWLLDAMLYVVLPPVSFFIIARFEVSAGVGAGLLFALAVALIVGALAWWMGARVLRLPPPSTGSLISVSMQGNTGYLGLPLVATFIGTDQLGAAIAYDTLISSPLLYGVGFAIGATMGTRAGVGARARVLSYLRRNPVLPAIALAVVVPDALAPDVAVDAAEVIAVALLPVGFFVLGVNLMHETEDGTLDFPPRLTAPLLTALVLRLVVAPALMLAAGALLLSVPDAYLLLAGMPAAINILIAAHAYGLDAKLMADAIAWGTAVVVVVAIVAAAMA
jgi:malate permease and related proteins